MNEQDKLLLLKVLSAMLPHGVIVNYKEGEYDFHKWKIETLYAPAYSESGLLIKTNSDGWIGYTEYEVCGLSSASRALHLDKNLPYLRPLSSMTEDEIKELYKIEPSAVVYGASETKTIRIVDDINQLGIEMDKMNNVIDFLNSHHFDHRGLIERGLALEAPKGMYKIK